MAKIISVSSFNGKIAWGSVSESGCECAIIRCGYGKNVKKQDDKQFANNMDGAINNGIAVSVYLYSYANDEASAKSEAEHTLRLVEPYKDKIKTVYIACLEEGTEEASKVVVDTFFAMLEENGYNTGVCSTISRFKDYLSDIPEDKRWVVAWERAEIPDIPFYLWEYTGTGSVFGINTDVQMIEENKHPPKKAVEVIKKIVEPKKEVIKDEEVRYKIISTAGLNIRADAGKTFPVVATFPYDFVLSFVGEKKKVGSDIWYKVSGTINGNTYTGYCISSFLQAV